MIALAASSDGVWPQVLLLACLMSPVAEVFPNLYVSWWAPANGNIERYLATWRRRVAVVSFVWIPLICVFATVAQPIVTVLVAAAVATAFGLRLRVFDRYLRDELTANNNEAPGGLSKWPEAFYLVVFTTIGIVLYQAVPDRAWLVPAAIGTIWTGAAMMANFRRGAHRHPTLDRVGRGVFVVGFLVNLYNLERASSGFM